MCGEWGQPPSHPEGYGPSVRKYLGPPIANKFAVLTRVEWDILGVSRAPVHKEWGPSVRKFLELLHARMYEVRNQIVVCDQRRGESIWGAWEI